MSIQANLKRMMKKYNELPPRFRHAVTVTRKAIPWVFLGIYTIMMVCLVKDMSPVLNGDELLEDRFVYSNSQLTAYVQLLYLGLAIALAFYLIRLAFAPDGMKNWRIRSLELRIEELERRLKDERDHRDTDRGHDAGESDKSEEI